MSIQTLFQSALKQDASDVHLVVGHRPTFRVDGELQPAGDDKPQTQKQVETMITSILGPKQKERLAELGDVDFAYQLKKRRFRVNVHKEQGRLALAARVIREEIPSMDTIGLLPVVQDLVNFRNGLVLVTGPTGVGKSTTLAAMINAINLTKRLHIITLEDPIEFLFPKGMSIVKQRELGVDIESFASGLRHVFRQNPDVIMVGEIRDLPSLATAITAAETGHLVFATLHTSSAPETIERIIDMFPSEQQDQIRSQLSLSLRAVVSQALLPGAKGGRVAAREIMINNAAIANLIRESEIEQIQNVIQTGSRNGMRTMKQDVNRLLKEKLVKRSDVAMFL